MTVLEGLAPFFWETGRWERPISNYPPGPLRFTGKPIEQLDWETMKEVLFYIEDISPFEFGVVSPIILLRAQDQPFEEIALPFTWFDFFLKNEEYLRDVSRGLSIYSYETRNALDTVVAKVIRRAALKDDTCEIVPGLCRYRVLLQS